MQNDSTLREDSALNVARRGVKIALACVFVVVLLGLINIYVLIVQIRATDGIHNRVVVLEKELKDAQKMIDEIRKNATESTQ